MRGYIKNLRSKVGQDLIIHPGARIILENDNNEFLFIQKFENNQLCLPAGAFEFKESIEECIKREVLEETGLTINEATMIGVSTHPNNEHVLYPNGDQVQYFVIEFYSNDFKGQIKPIDTIEVKSAMFKPAEFIKMLPKNEQSTFTSLDYFRRTNKVRLS